MKRFYSLALMSMLILGTAVRADDILQSLIALNQDVARPPRVREPLPSPPPPQPQLSQPPLRLAPAPVVITAPVPVPVLCDICETPVIVCPPQTIRRVVPRTTYQTVTKTIMVPTTVMETRQTQSVEYRDVVRERICTVYDQVPETRQVTTEYTVLVPQTRQRIESFTVEVPYERTVAQTYMVDNVTTETRTRKRIVCRCVPTTAIRSVTVGGEIVKREVKADTGGVKVQSVVTGGCKKEEAVTVLRKQLVEQTIAYDVQVNRPETRTRYVTQTDYRTESRTRSVPEVIHVPKTETRVHNVTEMRAVPRQQTETYTERIPHVVTRDVQVPVTRMVARLVTEQVPCTTYDVIEEPISNCVPCER